jgi:phospholipid/cholesterol/gamma-HCH transport system ATP-binding protein
MISLVNVHCSFSGVKALQGLSLRVEKGTLLGVMGPGGCGKSTLCRVIAGLEKPGSGVVFVAGCDMIMAGHAALRQVQSRLGVQFQNDALFEHLTVLENVMYPLRRLTDLSIVMTREKALEYLSMVGLAGFEDNSPSRLSGGQRRRVALARACVTSPDILICDDPTAGLDPVTSRRILDMIVGIRYQEKNTVIVVSSDVLGLLSVANRLALMWDGNVIAEGTPTEFRRNERREVKRFLADARLPFGDVEWD